MPGRAEDSHSLESADGAGGGGEQRDFTASQEEAPQGRRPLKAQQQEWKGSTGCLSQAGSELGARLARTLGVRGG